MEDTHQPPVHQMTTLAFNGHAYSVDNLVRLSGTMPVVVHPYAELKDLLESVMRVPNLNYPVVTHLDGKLVVLMLPANFVPPQMSVTQVKCRLANKHTLKRALTLEQPLVLTEPEPVQHHQHRDDRRRDFPDNHQTGARPNHDRPIYRDPPPRGPQDMRRGPPPITPTPRQGGPRPYVDRTSTAPTYSNNNNVDIRNAVPMRPRPR